MCSNEVSIKLSNIPFKLFSCLLKSKGKFVKNETLEKCWDNKQDYENFLVDKMSELENKLKKGLKRQEKIIERRTNDKRKIQAYKLPA